VVEKRFAYRVTIRMEDYLFFASTEKGRVAETAPLLHNYALAYALGWAQSPYYHAVQIPAWKQQLQPVNQRGLYIYPALPVAVSHRMMQYNTTFESFRMVKEKSMGIPNWGFIKCIRPGSSFQTYVLSADRFTLPQRIRLGKWMSQALVTVEEVKLASARKARSAHLVNIRDLDQMPRYFDSMYNLLPSRLVRGAEWEDAVAGYEVDGMFLPESSFWRVSS
jgi:CRISPR-associated protein Csc1